MEKRITCVMMLTLFLAGTFLLAFNIQLVKSNPGIIQVPSPYPTIQAAVNAATPGDIIEVAAGTYYEHIVVNKTLTLIGASRITTFIDGSGTGSVVSIEADNVVLTGFGIQHGYSEGVFISGFNNSTITDSAIILNGLDGIYIEYSHSNTIKNNIISNNTRQGPYFGGGINLYEAATNTISNNTMAFQDKGILSDSSNNNVIYDNTISSNNVGLELFNCSNSVFYHNNFVNNTTWQVDSTDSVSTWDNGYPSGGNYWSNYTGVDNYKGSSQSEIGSDGIGDMPYSIPFTLQKDMFPLMGPFNAFDAGIWDDVNYIVEVTSNSSVSNFYFDPAEGAFIRFSVTGATGTGGFCRVMIPKQLLWTQNSWTVLIGSQPVTPTLIPNLDNTYLYFTYSHSTKTVEVRGTHAVPEFQYAMVIPLFVVLTMLAVVLRKKDH